MAERDKHLFLATLADHANHYPDMRKEWKEVIILGELTITERQLLTDGFQRQMDRKLMAWRKLRTTEREQEIEGNEDNLRHTRDYLVALATSISKICGDVIDILLEYLIPTAVVTWEPIVFYHTMGEYYRYLAEVKTGEERRAAADEAKVAYEFATSEAVELSPSHPTRLRLALCLSDFYSEILNLKTSAYTLAKDALDDALQVGGSNVQGEGTMKLMQLLHEKIAELARAQPGVGQNLLDGPPLQGAFAGENVAKKADGEAWTQAEHCLLLLSYSLYGNDWKKGSKSCCKTRNRRSMQYRFNNFKRRKNKHVWGDTLEEALDFLRNAGILPSYYQPVQKFQLPPVAVP